MVKVTNKFSPEVIKKLQHYVYRLEDPRDNKIFYVGKGKGNRVFQHVEDAGKTEDKDDVFKIKIIKEIQKSGKKVVQIIHRWGLSEDVALELEAALIDAYEPLGNSISGIRSDISPMPVEQIQDLLETKEIAKFKHNVLMIKITNDFIVKRKGIYDAVRCCWKIDPERAGKADYVLAVCNGVIREVFEAEKWLKCSDKEFSGLKDIDKSRYGFKGRKAPSEIQNLYKDKLIPPKYRKKGMAIPTLYSFK